ncbi:MAG TPA: DUF1566 domain-containing protein [Azoarcus taiwanensis]|nr:DUF1566 domain-containing protein [Azoarcus taiwanensis]
MMRYHLQMILAVIGFMLLATAGCSREQAEPGVLRVVTQPGGADITINGQHYGTTPAESGKPLELTLPSGRYTIEAIRRGDEFVEFVGAIEVEHVDTRAAAPVVLSLERRLTAAGEAVQAEEVAQVEARRTRVAARFEPRDDGTVIDEAAGLMWMRCAIGQEWTGSRCTGQARQHNWDKAFEVAEETVYAGYDDWRLPTQPELYALTFCSTGRRSEPSREGLGGGCVGDYEQPTIIEEAFPDTPSFNFWTSTPHARLNYSAWGVSFLTGHTGTGGRSDFVNVRLVRDLD